MVIKVFPRFLLEQMWKEDEQRFALNTEDPPLCLRCGQRLDRRLVVNALSRYADVHICENCGMNEAFGDTYSQVLPLREWAAYSCRQVKIIPCKEPVLTADCTFGHIFSGPLKMFPYDHAEYPESEFAYFRSIYYGRRRDIAWYYSGEDRPDLMKKVNQFGKALLKMPEFKTLEAMHRFCQSVAQPTVEREKFNMYGEMERFYIRLRINTCMGDYNLYCHFYLKEAVDRIKPE